MVSYDDFSKLDLRIAKIEHAEPIGEKLYKLVIDLGNEKRTLVAGIRKMYPDPDSLMGKKIVVIVNLDPRIIRGVVSQGMLLATESSLIVPDKDTNVGDKVM